MTNTKLNHLLLKRDAHGKFLPIYEKIAYFKYCKNSTGESVYEPRKVKIEKNNTTYLEGIDLPKNAYRRFLKHKMIGLSIRREKIP
ncbi:MAG: hypothetical protein AABY22_20860 [Nanoarchaeota archaeon]